VEERRNCYKCGYETVESLTKCPTCGRKLLSTKLVRRLGWAQLLVGVFLVGFIAIIIANIAPGMLNPGVPDASGSRFTGTREQGQIVLALLGVIIVFGLTSFVNGVWQIATGKRNKWILYFGVGLFIILLAFVWAVENVFARG
jgi:hypothetical protein